MDNIINDFKELSITNYVIINGNDLHPKYIIFEYNIFGTDKLFSLEIKENTFALKYKGINLSFNKKFNKFKPEMKKVRLTTLKIIDNRKEKLYGKDN